MTERSVVIVLLVVTTALIVALLLAWRYSRIRTLKEFSAWAGAVQSIVVTIAVCVGGAWALAVFLALQQARSADEDLNERLSRRTALEMSFETADVSASGGPYDIVITTVLKNAGARALPFNLANATICIRPLDQRCSGDNVHPLRSMDGGNEAAGALLLAPGVTRRLPVHWRTSTPGIYLFAFDSPIPAGLQSQDPGRITRYRGWTFFRVPPGAPPG